MKTKRRTATTIENHEIWVIRRSAGESAVFCADCSDRIAMVKPEEAARLSRVSLRTIFRWVEDGCVHFTETVNAGILICLASILAMDSRGEYGSRSGL
jgi:hypothetical protein